MNTPVLTEKQKKDILEEWNYRPKDPPSLLELIGVAYPDEKVDGRSKEGRAVKAFLATREIKARASHEYQHKEKIDLTEEQKEYIKNNMLMMKGVEIARVLFQNHRLSNLSQETRTVNEYIKSIETNVNVYEPTSEALLDEYKPSKTFDQMLARINRYTHDSLDKQKMTPKQKKDVMSLISFVHVYRFLYQVNSYTSQSDRDLFESSFVRYTHDKYDLTQEEIDQYIVLSTEVVIASSIQARVEHLRNLLDDTANDSEGRRISMSLVEAISSAQTEYNQSVNRQQKLLDSLKEKRSDRLKKQQSSNASILNLVETWKEEENRKKLIKLAEERKKIIKNEIDSLSSMDEVKARILGLDENRILNE